MRMTMYCPAHKVKQLQELVTAYGLRWLFNPYPLRPGNPEGEWCVGIDGSHAPPGRANAFHAAWVRLQTPIRETVRKPTLRQRLRRRLRHLLRRT